METPIFFHNKTFANHDGSISLLLLSERLGEQAYRAEFTINNITYNATYVISLADDDSDKDFVIRIKIKWDDNKPEYFNRGFNDEQDLHDQFEHLNTFSI